LLDRPRNQSSVSGSGGNLLFCLMSRPLLVPVHPIMQPNATDDSWGKAAGSGSCLSLILKCVTSSLYLLYTQLRWCLIKQRGIVSEAFWWWFISIISSWY
jgi:hypothetical protein